MSRIFAEDDGERMPPPQAKLPLSEQDKQILQRWIAQGAKYEVHWAFRRPTRPAVPLVEDCGLASQSRSMRSCWPGWKPRVCGLRPKPIGSR